MAIDSNTVVSVVAALENDASCVEQFLISCERELRSSFQYFEILLVDDGSEDETAEVVGKLLEQHQNVRYMKLSRAFGRDIALSAGLESAIGDFVVTLDPRVDPPAMIVPMLVECRKFGGVVHGVAGSNEGRGFLREALGSMFRNYCRNHLGVVIKRGMGEYRAMSRQCVNALLQVKAQNRFLKVLTSSLGFKQSHVEYTSLDGSCQRERSIWSEVSTAIDLVAANTRHPLRILTWTGMLAAFLNVAYAMYVVVIYLAKPDVAQGWTTLSMQQSVMFFFVFLILAALSEYVGTLLAEVRTRPLYFLAGEKTSSVLLENTIRSSIVGHSNDSDVVRPDN